MSEGLVILEAISALLNSAQTAKSPLIRIRMSQSDNATLIQHVNKALPLGNVPQESFACFAGVEVLVDRKVPKGEVHLNLKDGSTVHAEYQIIWEALHEIPSNRFRRIDGDIV
jgi:hypothetical protein